ncbi:CBO0543 family protein [Paenibacillus aurantiacus]|uniref:CBO0543 family protein n=1 Tax=Paenibacillus aurantiacus TaxID=1936118 RepID=A0ABV5L0Z5_9BACL
MVWLNWRYRTYRRWRDFQPTLLYVAACDLLYQCLCSHYLLWTYVPKWPIQHQLLTNYMYTFVFLPATALMFIFHYPAEGRLSVKLLYMLKWYAAFVLGEGFYVSTTHMAYGHGWTLWWSMLFNVMMFSLMLLHHNRPLWAYGLTAAAAAFWVIVFHIPLS